MAVSGPETVRGVQTMLVSMDTKMGFLLQSTFGGDARPECVPTDGRHVAARLADRLVNRKPTNRKKFVGTLPYLMLEGSRWSLSPLPAPPAHEEPPCPLPKNSSTRPSPTSPVPTSTRSKPASTAVSSCSSRSSPQP